MKEYDMSLSERLQNVSVTAKASVCKIGKILQADKLTQEDKKYLSTILDVPENDPNRVTNAALARVLREEGFDVSDSSVDRHRRGDCSCQRKISK
jgi:hypothetical protein